MSTHEPESDLGYGPRTVTSALWAHRWSALAVVVIVVAGAMFLSYRQTPIFQSTAEVLVPPPVVGVVSGGNIDFGNVALEDEAKIALSQPVAAAVAKETGFTGSLDELTRRVRVSPSQGTKQVLVFQAQGKEPQATSDLANAFAAAYLAERNTANLDALTNRLKAVEARLNDVTRRLQGTNPDKVAAFAALQSQQTSLTSSRNDLASAIGQVKSDEPGGILQEAKPGSKPVKPNHLRDLLVAIVAGLLLAAGLALFLEGINRKLRGTDDVEAQSGGALVGAIPSFADDKDTPGNHLVVLDDPRSPAAEAYRTLRTGLTFAATGRGFRSLGVTSAEQGEGKSTTSANLALVMAQAESRVLLIDGDLRRPSLHTVLGLPNDVGLSEVLGGQSDLITAVQRMEATPTLRVLTSGAIPPNPVEMLGSAVMEALLREVGEAFDWVVIDCPPALGVADASVIAQKVDGILFIVSESTDREVVAQARDQLARVNTEIVGTALNNLSRASRTYYPGYTRQYAASEPGS